MRVDSLSALLLEAIEPSSGVIGMPDDRRYATWSHRQWDELLRRCDWHRLSGSMYGYVSTTKPAGVPAWVAEHLEARYFGQLARTALVDTTLESALDALAAAHIAVLLLKGVALIEGVYEDRATRDIGDIDLLVEDSQFEAARRVLEEVGFRPECREEPPRRLESVRAMSRLHDLPLLDPAGLLPIEIHHHIVRPGEASESFDPAELWSRARPRAQGAPHLLPAPEDLLLHICVHFTRGRETRSEGALGQVRDVASVIARGAINWELLVANACRYGVAGKVFLALFTAGELGVPVPADALRSLEPCGFEALTGRRFITERVLNSDMRLPVADWSVSVTGLRRALWWSRLHLGSRESVAPDCSHVLSRRAGLSRLIAQACRRPRSVVGDVRITRWMEGMT